MEIPQDTLSSLLAFPDVSTFSGLRDYGMLFITLDTGIRPGEALHLAPPNIDLKRSIVIVPDYISKTRQTKILPISDITSEAIQRLLKARLSS